MSPSQRFNVWSFPFIGSVLLFIQFIAYFCIHMKGVLFGELVISRPHLMLTIYRSGAKLTIPLVLISSLAGTAVILNLYSLLSPFYLQDEVLLLTQRLLFYDILPFIIALVLSIQLSLNLIRARIKALQRTVQDVILNDIIPLILGANFSALLLYIYCLNAILISFYFCFLYLSKTDVHEYLFHLSSTLTSTSIVYSIFKTLLYCTLVSFVVGYYYYVVAERMLSLRVAMSRIMTRSLLCLVVSSLYMKFMEL